MERACGKCGARNGMATGSHAEACPACGAIYAKVLAREDMKRLRTARRNVSATSGPNGMVGGILMLLVMVGLAVWWLGDSGTPTHGPWDAYQSAHQSAPAARAPANAESHIADGRYFGCSERAVYERLAQIGGDVIAFRKAFRAAITLGTCQVLSPGDPVYIDDRAVFAGLVAVRPHGDPQTYWTTANAVR